MRAERFAEKLQTTEPKKTRSEKIVFWLGFVIMGMSLCSGFATYFILTGLAPVKTNTNINSLVMWVNFALVIAMFMLIIWQVYKLWLARRNQAAAANLHVRIVSLFSVIAALPAILLAIFATISLDRGLDYLFSQQTQSIVRNSVIVAEAYVKEHSDVIRSAIIGMSEDIDRFASLQNTDKRKFDLILRSQALVRDLPMALLLDENGQPLKIAANRLKVKFYPPSKRAFELAQKGPPVIMTPTVTNHIRGLIKLKNFENTYLYVMRPVDKTVIQHLRITKNQVRKYKELQSKRTNVQFSFFLMQCAVALTLLLTAIWIGLWFANRIVNPIRRLITAAENVSRGNMDVRVKVKDKEGDLAKLSKTFNNMTFRLRTQRDELINANILIDDRRRFTEAVLSGVTAGVLGLDSNGTITLINPSAVELLGMTEESAVQQYISDAIPSFKELWEKAKEQTKNRVEAQVDILSEGVERHFAVRFTREKATEDEFGYVVTFDDITELVAAQRNTAWADIARRIAHEIKNPLTPIQLSAERIRRKYGDTLGQDRTVFDQCTDTIIRQVGDIGRMVDEFSSFARMPAPSMKMHDVRAVLRDAFILFQSSNPDIKFKLETPEEPVRTLCDERLLSQVVTNLVKNASEAISSVKLAREENGELYQGSILIRMKALNNKYQIEVIDNGCGLPETNRNKLVEPYMTTREKGTGLGLAIVQKITEQHGGVLRLSDAPQNEGFSQGACMRLIIPIVAAEGTSQEEKVEEDSSGSHKNTNKQLEANKTSAEKERATGVN